MLGAKGNFFIARSNITLSSCALFGNTQHTIIVDSSKARVPIRTVVKTSSVCSIIGFHINVPKGGIATLALTTITPTTNTSMCLLPCSARGSHSCATKGMGRTSGVSNGCSCCALSVHLGSGVIDYPLVAISKRIFNLTRGSSKRSATAVYCTVSTGFTVSRGVSTLSCKSVSLGNVNVGGTLPSARRRTLMFLCVTSSRLSPRGCVRALGSFVTRCPTDTSNCLHHTSRRLFVSHRSISVSGITTSVSGTLRITTGGSSICCGQTGVVCGCTLNGPRGICGS